jgi:Leucine-rich repeat (LRR) protein
MQSPIPLIQCCALLVLLCACQRKGPTSAYSVEEALAHPHTVEDVMLFDVSEPNFPDELFALPNLKSLEITFSQLDTLPPGLAKATQLKYLMLDGDQFQRIPEAVKQLPELEFFSLSTNPLRPDGLQGIGKTKTLRRLLLNQCGITSLPDEMAELPALTDLHLALNPMPRLPSVITRMPSLEHIWLAGGDWLQDSASIEVLRRAPKLRKVTLSLSGIPDETRDSLRNLLPHLRIL